MTPITAADRVGLAGDVVARRRGPRRRRRRSASRGCGPSSSCRRRSGPSSAKTVPSATSRSMPSSTTCLPYDLRRPADPDRRRGGGRRRHRRTSRRGCAGGAVSDVEVLHGRLPGGARDHVEELRRDLVAELARGSRRPRGSTPWARFRSGRRRCRASRASRPACPRRRPSRTARLALDVEDVLAGPAAVDAEVLRRACWRCRATRRARTPANRTLRPVPRPTRTTTSSKPSRRPSSTST